MTRFIDAPTFFELLKQSQALTQALLVHLSNLILLIVPFHLLQVQGSVLHRVASALLPCESSIR